MSRPLTLSVQLSMEEPRTTTWVFAAVGALSACAAALGVVAEVTRTQTYNYVMDEDSRFHCAYPGSFATPLAVAALLLLFAAEGLSLYYGGVSFMYSGPKYFLSRSLLVSILLFLMSSVSYIIATSTLLSGAVENEYHTKSTTGGFTTLQCSLVKEGTFLSGAVFSLVSGGLMEAFYVYAIKVRWEIWRTTGGYGGTPTAESELTGEEPRVASHG